MSADTPSTFPVLPRFPLSAATVLAVNTHTELTPTDLVTPGTAASELGVTTRTLINYTAAGRLHPVRTAGGQRRYRLREIRELQGTPPVEDHPAIEGQMSIEDVA